MRQGDYDLLATVAMVEIPFLWKKCNSVASDTRSLSRAKFHTIWELWDSRCIFCVMIRIRAFLCEVLWAYSRKGSYNGTVIESILVSHTLSWSKSSSPVLPTPLCMTSSCEILSTNTHTIARDCFVHPWTYLPLFNLFSHQVALTAAYVIVSKKCRILPPINQCLVH